MGHFCINRSGKNLTVTRTNGGGGVIGTIKPNICDLFCVS